MISTQDIKNKEVINIYDGKSLGFVYDIEVNLEKGTIEAIIVPAQKSFFRFFSRESDYIIKWKNVKRIGDDVILVDVAGLSDSDLRYDSGYDFKYGPGGGPTGSSGGYSGPEEYTGHSGYSGTSGYTGASGYTAGGGYTGSGSYVGSPGVSGPAGFRGQGRNSEYDEEERDELRREPAGLGQPE